MNLVACVRACVRACVSLCVQHLPSTTTCPHPRCDACGATTVRSRWPLSSGVARWRVMGLQRRRHLLRGQSKRKHEVCTNGRCGGSVVCWTGKRCVNGAAPPPHLAQRVLFPTVPALEVDSETGKHTRVLSDSYSAAANAVALVEDAVHSLLILTLDLDLEVR